MCFCRYHLLKTHQLPLDAFLVALKMMKVEDVDIDEVQCILANLIYMVRDVNVTVMFIVCLMCRLCLYLLASVMFLYSLSLFVSGSYQRLYLTPASETGGQ